MGKNKSLQSFCVSSFEPRRFSPPTYRVFSNLGILWQNKATDSCWEDLKRSEIFRSCYPHSRIRPLEGMFLQFSNTIKLHCFIFKASKKDNFHNFQPLCMHRKIISGCFFSNVNWEGGITKMLGVWFSKIRASWQESIPHRHKIRRIMAKER